MEYLDIVDENNILTGQVASREEAHEKNLFHRHVKCWIMNQEGEILLQRRSLTKKKAPGIWCKSGGHVDSGETVEKAIKREILEELGILIEDNQIISTKIVKSLNPKENYYSYNYIILVDYKIEDYKLQEEELSEVKYYSIEELEKLKQENNDQYSFRNWSIEDFNNEMNWLKENRKVIINKKHK